MYLVYASLTKRSKETIRKVFRYGFVVFFLAYVAMDISIYFLFKSDSGKIDYTVEKYRNINDDSIPDNLLNAWERVFPDSQGASVYPDLCWIIITKLNHKELFQVNLAYACTWSDGLRLYSNANQLDNRLSKKQCLFAYLSSVDYSNFNIGIDAAAKHYYNKRLNQLYAEECLELIVMSTNPSYYSKEKHPDLLRNKIKEIYWAEEIAD